MPEGYISVKEAADLFGYRVQYLYQLIKQYGAPAEQIGTTWIIHQETFKRWLADRKKTNIGRPPKNSTGSEP